MVGAAVKRLGQLGDGVGGTVLHISPSPPP